MSSFKQRTPAPRTELARFEAYRPGLSIQQIRRQYGLKRVIKLASNENSLGPSRKALAAYRRAARDLFRYPESRSTDLRGLIAAKFKVDLSEVIIGAGSDEVIELLAKTYLGHDDHVVVSTPCFMQYRLAAQLMGAAITEVPLTGMRYDMEKILAAVTGRTKLIFFAQPNNPTGTYATRLEIETFLRRLPERVLPIFDEAYFEYAAANEDYPNMIEDYFHDRPMVVLRTFSKVHGLAALRVGFGVAPESVITEMDKIRPPFNVSIPAQAAAAASLLNERHMRRSVALVTRERERVIEGLTALKFTVVPSVTNFLLFETSPWKGRALFEALLQRGVIIRSVDEYGLPNHARVTVGTASENRIFLQALREVTSQS